MFRISCLSVGLARRCAKTGETWSSCYAENDRGIPTIVSDTKKSLLVRVVLRVLGDERALHQLRTRAALGALQEEVGHREGEGVQALLYAKREHEVRATRNRSADPVERVQASMIVSCELHPRTAMIENVPVRHCSKADGIKRNPGEVRCNVDDRVSTKTT